MDQTINGMDSVFMEVVTKKLEHQDHKMAELEEAVNELRGTYKLLHDLINRVLEVKSAIASGRLPSEKPQGFSSRLFQGTSLLRQPVVTNVLHQHPMPKRLWVAAGLFLALCLVSAGWYWTGRKLDDFVANDTKYRYLKLDTARGGLQKYLYVVDSLYRTHPDMRRWLLRQEVATRQQAVTLDQAKDREPGAKQLRNNVFKASRSKGKGKAVPVLSPHKF